MRNGRAPVAEPQPAHLFTLFRHSSLALEEQCRAAYLVSWMRNSRAGRQTASKATLASWTGKHQTLSYFQPQAGCLIEANLLAYAAQAASDKQV